MSGRPTERPAVVARVCPTCGATIVGEVQFCPTDGARLQPVRDADPLVGRRIGAYVARRRIAMSGMGRVYLAEHVDSGRRCVLKVLDVEHGGGQSDASSRFRREATNQARLRGHPHVCELYETGTTDDGLTWIAMAYVAGESLHALLQRTPVLPPPRVAELVRQAAAGLAAAHAIGLVHRDLKPENIMVAEDGPSGDHVTLIDFGIAKDPADGRQRVTGTGVTVGTPQFMSPEQLAADDVGPRSDLYALGVVTFLMLTGAMPYDGSTPDGMRRRLAGQLRTLREARTEVRWPAALEAAIARALAASPEDRHGSVTAFAHDVGRAIAAWGSSLQPADRPPASDAATPPAADVADGGERATERPGMLARWKLTWTRRPDSPGDSPGGSPPTS